MNTEGDCILNHHTAFKHMLLSLNILVQSNLEIQKNILNHVCVLDHRFLELDSDRFPRTQCDLEEEQKIRKEFQTKKDELRSTNSMLDASYTHLQNLCERMKSDLEKIKGARPCQLCEWLYGSSYPILHHIEKYSAFYKGILSVCSGLMLVEEMLSVLKYKDLLESYEEQMESLADAMNKAINDNELIECRMS